MPAAEEAAPVVIEAERLVLADGVATATGGVRLQWRGDVLTGDEATVDLESRVATLVHADLKAGPLRVTGDRFVLAPDRLEGDHVRFTRCDCPGPEPWTVTAAHAVVIPDEVVRFRSAVVHVFDVPVFWVPAGSLPLSRRSGLLAPSFNRGVDGVRIRAPLFLAFGPSADATLTPEVRTARSVRLLTETRYAAPTGRGITTLASGWDWKEEAVRGGLDWDHAHGGRSWLAVAQGQLVSDEAYFQDYADGFLARHVPWGEARTLVGVGPVELQSDVLQASEPAFDDVATLAVRHGETRLPGGFTAGASASAGLWVLDATSEQGFEEGRGSATVARPTWLGPVMVEPRVSAFGALAVDAPESRIVQDPALDASALVRLPFWHQGRSFDRIEPEVVVVEDLLDPGVPDVLPGLRLGTGSRSGDALAHLAALPGGRAMVDARLAQGRWAGWVQGRGPVLVDGAFTPSIDLGTAGLAWDLPSLHLDVGAVGADRDLIPQVGAPVPLAQVRAGAGWTLPGRLNVLRLDGAASRDLAGDRFLSEVVGLRWTHPTGCATARVAARFEVDRDLPDLALSLDLRP